MWRRFCGLSNVFEDVVSLNLKQLMLSLRQGRVMKTENDYPGADCDPVEILALANQFKDAAIKLLAQGRSSHIQAAHAPVRLCALHAIELYLNAYHRFQGEPAEKVRAYMHNFAIKAARAKELGLVLKTGTSDHLDKVSDKREYLVSRYAPGLFSELSQTNRLEATLNEVSNKVTKALAAESKEPMKKRASNG